MLCFVNDEEILKYDEQARSISASLMKIREDQGLSRNRLAEITGLSWAGLMRIETGERIPSISSLMRIADSLEVKLWEVIRDFKG